MSFGASVVIADVNEEGANEAAGELTETYDGTALGVKCDVD